jgi:acetyltransferase-like isoleucine patch superfamily enzyme
VFIGPCVTMTDDRHPRVGNADYNAEPPVIGDDARIGAGVVILPGVVIGARAMVGAGSVVTSSVPAGAAVRGTPARAFDPPAEWVVQ